MFVNTQNYVISVYRFNMCKQKTGHVRSMTQSSRSWAGRLSLSDSQSTSTFFRQGWNPVFFFSQNWVRLACVPCVRTWRVDEVTNVAEKLAVLEISQGASQLKILEQKRPALSERNACCQRHAVRHWAWRARPSCRLGKPLSWCLSHLSTSHFGFFLCFEAKHRQFVGGAKNFVWRAKSPSSLRYIDTDFRWADGRGIRFHVIANYVISEVTCIHFKWNSAGPGRRLHNNDKLPISDYVILIVDLYWFCCLRNIHTQIDWRTSKPNLQVKKIESLCAKLPSRS